MYIIRLVFYTILSSDLFGYRRAFVIWRLYFGLLTVNSKQHLFVAFNQKEALIASASRLSPFSRESISFYRAEKKERLKFHVFFLYVRVNQTVAMHVPCFVHARIHTRFPVATGSRYRHIPCLCGDNRIWRSYVRYKRSRQ